LPDAIYVSPQGLPSNGSTGRPNSGGRDVAFTRAMIATLEASYCVDKARIFSTGFSYGGSMCLTLGCQMSDVFRAIGVQAGLNFQSCRPTNPVAIWQTNGDQDPIANPPGAMEARDVFVAANNCASTTQPVTPSPCVSYDGCDAGYPVVWCLVTGAGHSIPSFSSSAIAEFFKKF
jgi:polyhydroxybutyrate depolymerase